MSFNTPHRTSRDWQPSASRDALEARARLFAAIRRFFSERQVMEVETPLLSQAANSDPSILSISAETSPQRFLRTSPEFPMKRLLASGLSDIYELGKVFRSGESGGWHNPEFTMLEWYHAGWNYLELADEVVDLVRYCGAGQFDSWPVQRISYRELFQRQLGVDPFHCDEAELAQHAQDHGIRSGPLDLRQWLDLLISHVIQPALGGETITIVHDFPADQAALARIRRGQPDLAERFEVYLGPAELANGYQELTDATEQRQRFEREQRQRGLQGDDIQPLDERLLAAMEKGLPDCAGVALGVDRLLMAITRLEAIQSVLAFPWQRA